MKNDSKNRKVWELCERITDSNSEYELRDFVALDIKSQNEIYTKAYQTFLKKVSPEDNVYEQFIRALFSILHALRLTFVTSEDAVIMYRIYNQALYHYPQFAESSYDTQIRIMHEGYLKGRLHHSHDIHVFSKATFMVLAEEGLIDKVVNTDKIRGKDQLYKKVYERRTTRRDYDHPSLVYEYNALIFVTYEYRAGSNGIPLRTSIHVSDLWNLLSGNIIY